VLVASHDSPSFCLEDADIDCHVCNTLIAGQNINVGEVCVQFDQVNGCPCESITFKVSTTNSWYIDIFHLWVSLDINKLPKTSVGNPIPRQFPYKCTSDVESDLNECIIQVSLEDIYGSGYDPYKVFNTKVLYAVHVDTYKQNSDGTTQEETAWGNGTTIGKNWGMYCDDDCVNQPPPSCISCDTAFAYDSQLSTCFLDISNIENNRWRVD